ncbi:MAG: ATP-binding protein [Promethearchaeota archaeon]|nr:MAG: ATP-binding protein [Candidatus Lokiarchaeota archaeon]
MPENLVIAVAGKGGVGKTTFSALLLKVISKTGKDILMMDCDPDANMPDVLGIPIMRDKTVGGKTASLKEKISKGQIPPQVTKDRLLEQDVFEVLQELDDFDLLTMGCSEGPGCYCFANQIVTQILDKLSKNYDITLMDMEAGLEHLSRRTTRDVDTLILVTDASKMGLTTVKRIKELSSEVGLKFKKIFVVGNRFTEELKEYLDKAAEESGIEVLGIIPPSDEIAKSNLEGRSLLELPDESPAVRAVHGMAKKLGLI